MSDHPETDAHVASLKKTPSCFCETSFAERMEIDRNRWRSVAEQLVKMKPTHPKHCICVLCKSWDEAIRAFDSLRKEQGL